MATKKSKHIESKQVKADRHAAEKEANKNPVTQEQAAEVLMKNWRNGKRLTYEQIANAAGGKAKEAAYRAVDHLVRKGLIDCKLNAEKRRTFLPTKQGREAWTPKAEQVA